jgi:hypothetical protein
MRAARLDYVERVGNDAVQHSGAFDKLRVNGWV